MFISNTSQQDARTALALGSIWQRQESQVHLQHLLNGRVHKCHWPSHDHCHHGHCHRCHHHDYLLPGGFNLKSTSVPHEIVWSRSTLTTWFSYSLPTTFLNPSDVVAWHFCKAFKSFLRKLLQYQPISTEKSLSKRLNWRKAAPWHYGCPLMMVPLKTVAAIVPPIGCHQHPPGGTSARIFVPGQVGGFCRRVAMLPETAGGMRRFIFWIYRFSAVTLVRAIVLGFFEWQKRWPAPPTDDQLPSQAGRSL